MERVIEGERIVARWASSIAVKSGDGWDGIRESLKD
jgi:hypothetical protein